MRPICAGSMAKYDPALELIPGSQYTDEEDAFIRAVAAYKARTRKKFICYTEVLLVAKSLGYVKCAKP